MISFIVYALLDPTNLHIRYVGLTKNLVRRKCDHTIGYSNRKNHKSSYARWQDELREHGLIPIFAILGTYSDVNVAKKAEQTWIESARASGFDLVNYYEGGSTYIWPPLGGKYQRTEKHRQPVSLEVRARMSASAWKRGKHIAASSETRAKMSVSQKLRCAGRPAVEMTLEVKVKLSRKLDEHYAAKLPARTYAEQELAQLEPHEQRVMRLRLGIGGPRLTRIEIVELLGWSRNRVRWAERTSRKKLEAIAA